MPKRTKSIYSQTPVVPKKQIAASNPMGTVSLGFGGARLAPQGPSTVHGFDVPAHSFKTPSVKGAHGYGRVAKIKRGSGVPKPHRIGVK